MLSHALLQPKTESSGIGLMNVLGRLQIMSERRTTYLSCPLPIMVHSHHLLISTSIVCLTGTFKKKSSSVRSQLSLYFSPILLFLPRIASTYPIQIQAGSAHKPPTSTLNPLTSSPRSTPGFTISFPLSKSMPCVSTLSSTSGKNSGRALWRAQV